MRDARPATSRPRRFGALSLVISLSAASLVAVALAERGATQAADRQADAGQKSAATEDGDKAGIPVAPRGRAGSDSHATSQPATDARWEEVRKFMAEYCPNRLEAMRKTRPERRAIAGRMLFARYQQLQRLQKTDPKLFKLVGDEIKLQDDLFSLTIKLRKSKGSEKEEAEQEIHEKISKLVENNLARREAQIQHQQELLNTQRARLEADEKRRDETVKKWYDNVVSHGRPGSAEPVATPESAPSK